MSIKILVKIHTMRDETKIDEVEIFDSMINGVCWGR